MSFKHILAILVLQLVSSSLADVVQTVIDTTEDLNGYAWSANYVEAASALPDELPAEIRASGSKGVWLFSESENNDGAILATSQSTYSSIALKVYNTKAEGITLFFQDKAQDDAEHPVKIPKSVGNSWAEDIVLQVDRKFISAQQLSFRFEFPESTSPNGHFLLDSITINGFETTEPLTYEIDTKDQLMDGFSLSETYLDVASQLVAPVPGGIINSKSKGIWVFSEEKNGGSIAIAPPTTITRVTLKYFNMKEGGIELHFKDFSQDNKEHVFRLSKTAEENWAKINFDVVRELVSTEPIYFEFQFPEVEGSDGKGQFLVDSISITGLEVGHADDPTTTQAPTTTGDGDTTPTTGIPIPTSTDGDNASSAIAPTVLSVVSFIAILKAFM
jgi:hypothetical protein